MNLKAIILLLPLWACLGCLAQALDGQFYTYGNPPQPQGDFYHEIPFEYNGQIMLKVGIGNKTYDFAFDTGGTNMITDAVMQELGLEVLGEKELGSSNGLVKNTTIIYAPTMALGGLIIDNVQAYQVNFDNSPIMQCMVSGGFIGNEIIKNYIWQIDYPNRRIAVTNSMVNLPAPEGRIALNVHVNKQNQPYVLININGTYQYMIFDTGCNSMLMMSEKDAAAYTTNAKGATLLGGTVETHNGSVRDTLMAFDARVSVQGTPLFHKPAVYRAGAKLNLLGNPIIKNYIVTLDFAHDKMYLDPIQNAPVTDGWEHFGFTLEYNGDCAVIGSILAGSAAQKAGLSPGDEVTALNGKKITCSDYCNCRTIFNDLAETSSKISLTVLKNGVPQTFSFKKEKIF